jgi:hypothetical protein
MSIILPSILNRMWYASNKDSYHRSFLIYYCDFIGEKYSTVTMCITLQYFFHCGATLGKTKKYIQ